MLIKKKIKTSKFKVQILNFYSFPSTALNLIQLFQKVKVHDIPTLLTINHLYDIARQVENVIM